MMNQNELEIKEKASYLWITLPDAITMYDNKEIEQKIGERLRDRKDHVVLDFSHTRAVYSSGLGLMIRIRRFVTERGGTLSLVNVSERLYDMFRALNIEKVFPIYTTDVEFEISQDDFGNSENQDETHGFLFVAKNESGACRIHLSGDMSSGNDLEGCSSLQPISEILLYLFDFSGLESIDSAGAEILLELTKRIIDTGGVCRAYGIHDMTHEMLTLFGADVHFTFFTDEQSAFEGTSPVA
ncbi:MAG: STAS domain-containing protein [Chitinispirillaceae bacterium]|nr:STAS domain-containing protein [Chitinispirillaceae bacterium]